MQRLYYFLSRVWNTSNPSIIANASYLTLRYGLSTGTPTEIGLKMDAEASLMYLHSREDIHHEKIVC
jgi:hypothetical protein